MRLTWLLVFAIGILLVLTGGPAIFSGPPAASTSNVAPTLRTIPFRIQVVQPPDSVPFAVDLVAAIRTALFISSAGPEDDVGADAGALSAPHLVLDVRPRRGGYRLEGAVVRQPLGTLRPDTLVACGRGNLVASTPLEQGATAGAYVAAYVECFRKFADSLSRSGNGTKG